MERRCESCGGKRTFTPGPGSKHSNHKPKADQHHTLCDKCWKSLRTSTAPKSNSYKATRPGRPISELESIHDPGPGRETAPWDTLADQMLVAMGFDPLDLLSHKKRKLAQQVALVTPENNSPETTEIHEVGT